MCVCVCVCVCVSRGGNCRKRLVKRFVTTDVLLWSAAILVHCVATSVCFKVVKFVSVNNIFNL